MIIIKYWVACSCWLGCLPFSKDSHAVRQLRVQQK